ncbi:MAG: TRAP transporter small permease [Desulfohalobiaceae bacterium]
MPETEKERSQGLMGRLEWGMKVVAAACLMGMALVTGADVVGRAALDIPLFGSEEIVSILAVLVVGFSLPYAHSQGSHIGVEVVFQRLGRRSRRVVRLITGLASSGLFAVVAWQMVRLGTSMRASGLVSMNLALPSYWVVYALAFGFSVFSLWLLFDALHVLRGGGG